MRPAKKALPNATTHTPTKDCLFENTLTGLGVLEQSRSCIDKQISRVCTVSFPCNDRLVVMFGPTKTASQV